MSIAHSLLNTIKSVISLEPNPSHNVISLLLLNLSTAHTDNRSISFCVSLPPWEQSLFWSQKW